MSTRLVFGVALVVSIAWCACAAETDPAAVNCASVSYDKIIVHMSSAMVFGHVNLSSLSNGRHTVTLCNILRQSSRNRTVEEDSLQLSPSKGIIIERRQWENVITNESRLAELVEQRSNVSNTIRETRERLALLKSQDDLLLQLSTSVLNSGNTNAKHLIGETRTALDLLSDIGARREALYARQRELNIALAALEKQHGDLNTKVADAYSTQRVVRVILSVEREGDAPLELQIQHVVAEAKWVPQYEIRVNTTTGRATVNYNAMLSHELPTDLSNVTIELSTGAPSHDRRLPVLEPIHLRVGTAPHRSESSRRQHFAHPDSHQQQYKQAFENVRNYAAAPPSGSNQRSGDEASGAELDADDGDGSPLEAPAAVVVSSGISDIFSIRGKHTLPAKQSVVVSIATLDLEVNLTRTAVPLRSTRVFLQATIRNTSPFTLLPGTSLVFIDGSFDATNRVPLVGAGGTVALDIGVDGSMIVVRKLVSKRRESVFSLLSASTIIDISEYAIVIRNKRPHAVTVKVIDQVPVSMAKELAVKILKPFEADVKATTIDVPFNGVNATLAKGVITIPGVVVKSDASTELSLSYSVHAPEGLYVSGLDD